MNSLVRSEEIDLRLVLEEIRSLRAEVTYQSSDFAQTTFFSNGRARNLRSDEADAIRHTQASLPDPRLVRRIIRQRQIRVRFFGDGLFGDPAWDMLLDLTAARAEHKRVAVTSLCIAACVPPTTALRWIKVLHAAGLVERTQDDTDARRAFIALSDRGAHIMASYFAELGSAAIRLI